MNQASITEDEDNVPLSKSDFFKSTTEAMVLKQRKCKEESSKETSVKRKKFLGCKPKAIGKLIKFTSEGGKQKCHYEKFEFLGKNYELEDSVLLIPEDSNQKLYLGIIKDIFIQGEEGEVKLEVQWLYRPEELDKYYVRTFKSKDPRDLFYSFHRDEVFAIAVKQSFLVYYVPEKKQLPHHREHSDFIVKNVYDIIKKKLLKFTHNDFNEDQRQEIDLLLAKTISLVGDLPDLEKKKKILKSRRKQSVPKRLILTNIKRTSPERCNVDYLADIYEFLENNGLDRDKSLKELLEAVKHKCRVTKEKQADDCDYFWPDDVVPVVSALEKALYDSWGKDVPRYKYKLPVIVNKLKNSKILADRFLMGELKPEDIVTMKYAELTCGYKVDEKMEVIQEPKLKNDDACTSKSVS